MPPLLSIVGFLAWPATIGAAVLVFGTSSETALSLLHPGLGAGSETPSVIKASMPTPVIRMPATPVISPEAAHAKIVLLTAGRSYASASANADRVAPATGAARMRASTGLTIRAKPMKGSAAVGSIAKGATVEVRSKHGGWMLISDQSATGWVFGKYLTPAPASMETRTAAK